MAQHTADSLEMGQLPSGRENALAAFPGGDEHSVGPDVLRVEDNPEGARFRGDDDRKRRPPGFTEAAAKVSRADCTAASSRTSSIVVVQRACGLRCHVPTPLHGASTRTPSHLVLKGAARAPVQTSAR